MSAENEGAESTEKIEFEGEFDRERAEKALAAARAGEKEAKEKAAADIAELQKRLAKYEKQEAEKAEAEKALEVKLAEANNTIDSLKAQAAERDVKDDFIAKATARGYADPYLAYAAAKDQGILGQPAEGGTVGDHDFEALEESHPIFAAEAGVENKKQTGDAAAKSGGTTKTAADRFNEMVRGSITDLG